MERADRAIWAERVQGWVDSGLTAKEYAAETGLNVNSLTHWKWRLGAEARALPRARLAAPPVVEVKLEEAAPRPNVEVGGAVPPFEMVLARGLTVRVPQRFDVRALRELLHALEAR
jgi:hypothetical protein